MQTGYANFAERPGRDGLVDKLTVMDAVGRKNALDNGDFRRGVLRVVALDPMLWRQVDPDGQVRRELLRTTARADAADEQLRRVEAFMRAIRYVREIGEIIQAPDWLCGFVHDEIPPLGGDCDDLAVAFHAAALCMDVPSRLQILADQNGRGYHIRNLVGLPPLRPEGWLVIDLVEDSEPIWAMADRGVVDVVPSTTGGPSVVLVHGTTRDVVPEAVPESGGGAGGIVAFLLGCIAGAALGSRGSR